MVYPLIFPEAMACREYCVNLGKFIDGDCYADDKHIIFVSPSIWEIAINGNSYSCHILRTKYHFELEYDAQWTVGEGVPSEFVPFVEEAYSYSRFRYPKLLVIV